MQLYSKYIKEYRGLRVLNNEVTQKTLQSNTDYRPFIIERTTVPETKQAMNMLRFNPEFNINIAYAPNLLRSFEVSPILEVEWFKKDLDLSDEISSVLEQLGYKFMAQILAWGQYHMNMTTEDAWQMYMIREGAVIEVDELEDTPAILFADPLSQVNLPKFRSWAMVYMYAQNFPKLFYLCKEQTSCLKEFYYHLPILLAMFMIDYHANKLDHWSKHVRLDIENVMRECMENFSAYSVQERNIYTYGVCISVTSSDINLIHSVFTLIYDKIHDLNTEIGLITYHDYINVRGPETVRASIRLANMEINWCNEMRRAEEENKQSVTD